MALINTGPVVTAIRGSIAGVTFSNSKSGQFIRRRYRPRITHSAVQCLSRGLLFSFSKQWYVETVNQYAFNQYALHHPVLNRLGLTAYLSGFQWFCSMNRIAQIMGIGTLINNPPVADATFINITNIAVTDDIIHNHLYITVTYTGANSTICRWEIMASPNLSPGCFKTVNYRFISVNEILASPDQFDIWTYYTAMYGGISGGRKIFFKIRLVSQTGESSPWQSFDLIVI